MNQRLREAIHSPAHSVTGYFRMAVPLIVPMFLFFYLMADEASRKSTWDEIGPTVPYFVVAWIFAEVVCAVTSCKESRCFHRPPWFWEFNKDEFQ